MLYAQTIATQLTRFGARVMEARELALDCESNVEDLPFFSAYRTATAPEAVGEDAGAPQVDASLITIISNHIDEVKRTKGRSTGLSFRCDSSTYLACAASPDGRNREQDDGERTIRLFLEAILPRYEKIDIAGHVEFTGVQLQRCLRGVRAPPLCGARGCAYMRVKELDLSSCALGDLGVSEVAGALRPTAEHPRGLLYRLRVLRLDGVGMGDDGCRALCKALIGGDAKHQLADTSGGERRRSIAPWTVPSSRPRLDVLSVEDNPFSARALPQLLSILWYRHDHDPAIGHRLVSSLAFGHNTALSSGDADVARAFYALGASLVNASKESTPTAVPTLKARPLSSEAHATPGLYLSLRGTAGAWLGLRHMCLGLLHRYEEEMAELLLACASSSSSPSHPASLATSLTSDTAASTFAAAADVEVNSPRAGAPPHGTGTMWLTSLDLSHSRLGDEGVIDLAQVLVTATACGTVALHAPHAPVSPLKHLRSLRLRNVGCGTAALPWLTTLIEVLMRGADSMPEVAAPAAGGDEVAGGCASLTAVSEALLTCTAEQLVRGVAHKSVAAANLWANRNQGQGAALALVDISQNYFGSPDAVMAAGALLAAALKAGLGITRMMTPRKLWIEQSQLTDAALAAACLHLERGQGPRVGPSKHALVTVHLGHNRFTQEALSTLRDAVGRTCSAGGDVVSQIVEGYVEGNHVLVAPASCRTLTALSEVVSAGSPSQRLASGLEPSEGTPWRSTVAVTGLDVAGGVQAAEVLLRAQEKGGSAVWSPSATLRTHRSGTVAWTPWTPCRGSKAEHHYDCHVSLRPVTFDSLADPALLDQIVEETEQLMRARAVGDLPT